MAGALSLEKDIEALVEKHKDVALPVDLLSRLAEDARLMAVKENIRWLHEADSFGLFAEESESKEESDDQETKDRGGFGTVSAAGKVPRKKPRIRNLPESVERMLSMMKVTKYDKVTALNGFTMIDADIEFLPASHAQGPKVNGAETPSVSSSKGTTVRNGGNDKGNGKAHRGRENKGKGADTSSTKTSSKAAEALPVHLHFHFVRESLDQSSSGGILPRDETDSSEGDSVGEHESDDGDEDSDAAGGTGVEVEYLDDAEGGTRKTGAPSGTATKSGSNPKNTRKVPKSCEKEGGSKPKSAKHRDADNTAARTATKGNDESGEAAESRQVQRGGCCKKRRCCTDGNQDADSVRGDGLRRKRPKGTPSNRISDAQSLKPVAEEEEGEDDGRMNGWVNGVLSGDGISIGGSESDDEECVGNGLGFEPRTLVSYTISGGVGFEQPEVLLQAVVYARGDGPACFTPSRGCDDDDSSDEEDEGDFDEDNQEDAFDANVDGEALSAIGKALGLHVPPVEDSDTEDEEGGVVSKNRRGEDVGDMEADGDGGIMMLEDLVWWLMMFPFFEKEFDIVGVVASCIFGEGGSDGDVSGDSDGDEDEDDGQMGNLLLIHGAPGASGDDESDGQSEEEEEEEEVKRGGVTIEELD